MAVKPVAPIAVAAVAVGVPKVPEPVTACVVLAPAPEILIDPSKLPTASGVKRTYTSVAARLPPACTMSKVVLNDTSSIEYSKPFKAASVIVPAFKFVPDKEKV